MAPVLVTGLPKLSWTWTANGPTVAVPLTGWFPETVEVNTSLLAFPATMVKPLVVARLTDECVDGGGGRLMVGVPALVSE